MVLVVVVVGILVENRQPGGSGTVGQGNNGGTTMGNSCSPSGGGGGAGGVGAAGTSGQMKGGAGLPSTIQVLPFIMQAVEAAVHIAPVIIQVVLAVVEQLFQYCAATTGTPNTGGGGGGGTPGGAGSGIVIIAYPDSITSAVTVRIISNQPNTGFTVSNSAPIAGQSITLSDTTRGVVDTRLWDFGNGNTSTVLNPMHIYSGGGVFNIKLIDANCAGKDSVIKTINVTPQNTYYRMCVDASSSASSDTLYDSGGSCRQL